MIHIKSEELCERCAYGVKRCMEKWDEDGNQCDGCRMNRGRKGRFENRQCLRKDSSSQAPQNDSAEGAQGDGSSTEILRRCALQNDSAEGAQGDGSSAEIFRRCALQNDSFGENGGLPEHICVCDEIADGTPCEYFEEEEE